MNKNQHAKQNSMNIDTLKQKIGTIKHIKENNTTYKAHWWRAMSMSVALFIHAWIPSLFPTYASDKMNHNQDSR
ncbi:MAG: hypothetical protein OEL56_07865 [Nitrosopumilus sp.]|nr:hypothetical protein [Nitrosopumilus sp.]MDH3517090.1 hypothetical protein [Nitrosopumilus sp.]MDH3564216.1 hypothetical protein [Nitrosopumilus sp.]MDH5417896.1 hypothetical protein [Nitrosopumilus sp.]MDH5554484.1 hypothetical protein [Nitrosopumilus sp.]